MCSKTRLWTCLTHESVGKRELYCMLCGTIREKYTPLFWNLSPTFHMPYRPTLMLGCLQPLCIKFYIFFMALLLHVISECSNFSGLFLTLPGVVWNKVHRGIYNRQIGQHPKGGYQVIILRTLHTCTLFRSIYKICTKITTSQSLPWPLFSEFMTLKCSLTLPAHSKTSHSKWSQNNCLFVNWSLRKIKFTPW